MKEVEFIPRYQKKLWFTLLGSGVFYLLIVFVLVTSDKSDAIFWIAFACISVLFCAMPFSFYKKILFHDKLYLERYFVGIKTIEYHDIFDIGFTTIRTKKGNIKFDQMLNSNEFISLVDEAINQGVIKSNRLEMKQRGKDVDAFSAAPISGFLVFILLLTNWKYSFIKPSLPLKLFGFILWVCLYLIVYFIFRIKRKRESSK